jgi:orotate phosphoribosyltransferase
MRERLRELIVEHAFQYADHPVFKLASGGLSRFYFNCKRVTLDPEGQVVIGRLVFDAVRRLRVQAVGGLTLGADPIACAVAQRSWIEGDPIQAFVVRKQPKEHGIVAAVEGKVHAGDRVVVVDDVITTGASTLKAIAACRHLGLEVVKVVVLVDRQEMNGRANILREVPDVEALTTRAEVLELYERRRGPAPVP